MRNRNMYNPVQQILSIVTSNRALLFCASFTLLFAGCASEIGTFFDKEHIEIHSKDLIKDVSTIQEVPEIQNPMPELYTSPPKIVSNSKGTKLYYFTRHHTPQVLSGLIAVQLAGCVVSHNPATNQLILQCPSKEDAQIALDFLEQVDVPPIQVRIDCLISELFADITLDWETTLEINDLLAINSNPIRDVGELIADAIQLGTKDISGTSTGVPNFPGAAARSAGRRDIGLKVGLFSADDSFNAVVDMLISRGYLKILMNPTLRVVNGQKAIIKTTDSVAIEKTVTDTRGTYKITDFKDVIDSLEVVPTVYADGSVGLDTIAKISSRSTPEGVTQSTIFTTREVTVKENRIAPGSSLVIGGIRKSEQLGIVRGVPFLKDIPGIGILFSSKDEEASAKEIMFILTPTITNQGSEHAKLIEEIRRKHARPEKRSILKTITDPLGQEVYTEHVEKKALEAEQERIKAEVAITAAQQEISETEAKLAAKKAALEQVQAEMERIRQEADKAKAEAQAAALKMKQSQQQASQIKAKADQTAEEAARIKREAEQAKAEAESAKTAAAQADAEKAQIEAEMERLRAEKLKAQAEAERAKAEAEKAKSEAEKAKNECPPCEDESQENDQQTE